jgi:hypothetical protein
MKAMIVAPENVLNAILRMRLLQPGPTNTAIRMAVK